MTGGRPSKDQTVMVESGFEGPIKGLVSTNSLFGKIIGDPRLHRHIVARIDKAFALLPGPVQDLFISRTIGIVIMIEPDPGFPLGMRTTSSGPADNRLYSIVVLEEHGTWLEDRFIAALLHELGHVVARLPPPEEWPTSRAERAQFKEMLECRADCMVWKWGLKEYSMCYLTSTYPAHRIEAIVAQIEEMIENDRSTGQVDS